MSHEQLTLLKSNVYDLMWCQLLCAVSLYFVSYIYKHNNTLLKVKMAMRDKNCK